MRNILIIFLFFAIIVGCSKDGDKFIYQSKGLYNFELTKTDSIKITFTDSSFIGRIGFTTKLKKYILLTDVRLDQVIIYDNNFHLIKKVGRKGKGPGEFRYSPLIISNADSLMLFDAQSRKVYSYNSDFNLITTMDLSPKFIYLYKQGIKIGSNYVFSAVYPYSVSKMSYYKKYKSLVILNKNFTFKKECFKWDNIYFDKKLFGYASENYEVLLAGKNRQNFFALQTASFMISKIDSNFKVTKKFGIRPRYFKTPPKDIKPEEIQSSFQSYMKFKAHTTEMSQIAYDRKTQRLFVNYVNSSEELFYKRNSFLGNWYLQIYNKNYDCIFDDKIDGIFLLAENDNIYVLKEENPKYFIVKIYRLNSI